VLGPLLALWLFYSLYQQVAKQPDLNYAYHLIKNAPFNTEPLKFWFVIFLVFANWGIETAKWQLLINVLEPLSFLKALKSVLCGVTLSLNTPNRIGEYGGRILFIKEENRLQAISLSVAGGIAQLIITLLMGVGGLFFLLTTMTDRSIILGLSIFWIKTLMCLTSAFIIFLILLFFKLNWIQFVISKIPYANKWVKYTTVLDDFDANVLLRLLFLSLFRYLIFVFQYILVLQLLQVQMDWWQSFWLITALFWVLAIVPSFAIAELGIRGKFGIALFSIYSSNTIGIIGTTFGIWFINLFIPALIGCVIIISTKIVKDK
jgi:Lysylphosphatidylglycerol synthase TM region